MANKDFKVKNGLDIQSPLPVSMGGTGQTSTTNSLNSLLPSQAGNTNKVLATDGTNTTWVAQALAYERGGTASRPASPTVGDLYYNTDNNYFESYTTNGWFPIAAAPGIPTGVTATNQPTNRAYNNGQMSVAFTPATSGGAASSFIVTPSPTTSPATFTGSTSPIVATGLASSTQYTYTVSATSPYGTSAASSASSAVTATTVPQAPTINSVTGGDAQASVTFTANATGGSSITGYSITSSPASTTTTQTASSSPYTFTGLTNGTAYTFTATATNANGTSAASAASSSVTPAVPAPVYVIGGRGPGTGIIVYDAGSVLSWGRYIEVANSTSTPAWSDVQAQWSGNTSTVVSGATNTALGQGMISTLAIIAQDSTSNRAATLCRAYAGGGFTSTSNGWFLGSIGDWANMFSNKGLVQATWQSGYYWGSSNNAANNLAWAIDMNSGSDPQQSKSSNHWVKPMRYFS